MRDSFKISASAAQFQLSKGIINPRDLRKLIKSNTVLVSVGYANNEIGTIQPIREIAKEISGK